MQDESFCPGPCNNRWRKARALYGKALADWTEAMAARAAAYETSPPGTDLGPEPPRPEEPGIKPWLGEPAWCRRCTAMIHAELSELDDLIAMLLAIPDLRAGADQAGKVSGTRGQRSPSPYADDADELAEWLRSWESLARGTDPAPRRGYLAAEITATAAWLVTHFEPLITDPDLAADYGQEIRGWHRTLKAKAHAGSATKHMPRPCPRCRLYTLWAADGEDYVVCRNEDCRRLMSREEYRDLTEDRVIKSRPSRTRLVADVLLLLVAAVIVTAGAGGLVLIARAGRRRTAQARRDAPRRLRQDLRDTDAYIDQVARVLSEDDLDRLETKRKRKC